MTPSATCPVCGTMTESIPMKGSDGKHFFGVRCKNKICGWKNYQEIVRYSSGTTQTSQENDDGKN